MENALLSEIYTLTQFIQNAKTDQERKSIVNGWKDVFNLDLVTNNPQVGHIIPQKHFSKEFDILLAKKLGVQVTSYYLDDLRTIRCEIDIQDFLLIIEFSDKRLQSSTTYIFIIWMIGTSLLLAVISLIFMKNQLRSILNLTEAAEKFGRGRSVDNFTPRGAKEIKNAGLAFIKMKKRLEKQINARTDLLNHISHDLRTPLTRMKLQLELMNDDGAKQTLSNNISEMQEMIIQYLNFAKGEGNEEAQIVNITSIINDIVDNCGDIRVKKVILEKSNILATVKINAIRRAISNLVDNARKFASDQVIISLNKTIKDIYITVEDDGIGIPENLRKDVFKPFHRLDHNQDGFGLGLTITKTIISAHGGSIILSQSALGGLKVAISLPY